jgi:two-component system, chemotaxis family, response regulator PixG
LALVSAFEQDNAIITKLVQNLRLVHEKRVSGVFIVNSRHIPNYQWQVFFHLGRVVWAINNQYRLRGWIRAIQFHCPILLSPQWMQTMALETAIHSSIEPGGLWEMYILNQAIQDQAITKSQSRAVIQDRVNEVFVDIIGLIDPKTQWISLKDFPEQLAWLDLEQILRQATPISLQWHNTLVSQSSLHALSISPHMALVIRDSQQLRTKVSVTLYDLLSKILDGRNTFWDVALRTDKSIGILLRSLMPLIIENILELKQLPDLEFSKPKPLTNTSNNDNQQQNSQPQEQKLAAPTTSSPSAATPLSSLPASGTLTSASSPKGLIVCIDDSPVIAKELESILQPLGYKLLSILDPLQGVSTLLKHKPDLIFLDVMMPTTNGYEFCTFLRKTAVFKTVPIVMLTGHNGMFDRMRAKAVGCSDFLSKPPNPEKVRFTLEKFLGSRP